MSRTPQNIRTGTPETGPGVPELAAAADRRLWVGVFFVALAVYFLTYTGSFKSNDERALFSGTDSFIKRGDFTVNQIYWDYTQVGVTTTAGDMVPNYEPAQMVAAIPFYLWGRLLGAGVQAVMFFGAAVMAAAVAMVYLCLLELGSRRRGALIGAGVFAFATMAWPYSRTFFREPLTAFAYLLATYAILRYRVSRAAGWAALAGAGLGLAITTKQISIALIPSLALLAVVCEWHRGGGWRGRVRNLVAFALPLGAFLVMGLVYTHATLSGIEVFARDIVDYTTNPQLSQSVPWRMARAFVGLTISPYKGLFWYSPVLLLGIAGAWPLFRRRRWEALAFALLVGAHLVGYSRYNYWSGGVAWGSRYMLVVAPYLILLAAPVWGWLAGDEAGPRRARIALQVGALALILVSAGVQLLGMSVDLRTWEVGWILDRSAIYGGLGEAIDALFMVPAESPVFGHWKLLASGAHPLDFAWMQLRPEGKWALVPAGLGLSLGYVLIAVAALVLMWRRQDVSRRYGVFLTVIGLGVASSLVVFYRQGDARYDTYNVDRFLKPMMADLAQDSCPTGGAAGCRDVFLMPDPALTDYFLNYLAERVPWYALEPRPVDEALGARLTGRYAQIWLGRDRDAASDDAEDRRGWERWLTAHAFKLDERRYENWARLLRYSAAGIAAEESRPAQALGELTLDGVWLGLETGPGEPRATQPLTDGEVAARPGDTLQVSLQWRAVSKPEGNYTAFVQLLDEAGQVRAQRDRWPGDGLYPTAGADAGGLIDDRLALQLDVPPGIYRLITGLYRGDVQGQPRLTGPQGDYVPLATIAVGAR